MSLASSVRVPKVVEQRRRRRRVGKSTTQFFGTFNGSIDAFFSGFPGFGFVSFSFQGSAANYRVGLFLSDWICGPEIIDDQEPFLCGYVKEETEQGRHKKEYSGKAEQWPRKRKTPMEVVGQRYLNRTRTQRHGPFVHERTLPY